MSFVDWISVAAPAAYCGWIAREIAYRRESRRRDRSQTPTQPTDRQSAATAQTDVQDDIHRMLDDLDSAAPLSDAPAQAGER